MNVTDEKIERVLKAARIIEREIENPELCAEQLSQETFFSTGAFQRVFKSVAQVSPLRFIRQRRFTRASQELLTSRSSIDVIARHCGYNSKEAFIKAFHKEFNISPHQYRLRGERVWFKEIDPLSEEYLTLLHSGNFSVLPAVTTMPSLKLYGINERVLFDDLDEWIFSTALQFMMVGIYTFYLVESSTSSLLLQEQGNFFLGVDTVVPAMTEQVVQSTSAVLFAHCGGLEDMALREHYIWDRWAISQPAGFLLPYQSLRVLRFHPVTLNLVDQDLYLPLMLQDQTTYNICQF